MILQVTTNATTMTTTTNAHEKMTLTATRSKSRTYELRRCAAALASVEDAVVVEVLGERGPVRYRPVAHRAAPCRRWHRQLDRQVDSQVDI